MYTKSSKKRSTDLNLRCGPPKKKFRRIVLACDNSEDEDTDILSLGNGESLSEINTYDGVGSKCERISKVEEKNVLKAGGQSNMDSILGGKQKININLVGMNINRGKTKDIITNQPLKSSGNVLVPRLIGNLKPSDDSRKKGSVMKSEIRMGKDLDRLKKPLITERKGLPAVKRQQIGSTGKEPTLPFANNNEGNKKHKLSTYISESSSRVDDLSNENKSLCNDSAMTESSCKVSERHQQNGDRATTLVDVESEWPVERELALIFESPVKDAINKVTSVTADSKVNKKSDGKVNMSSSHENNFGKKTNKQNVEICDSSNMCEKTYLSKEDILKFNEKHDQQCRSFLLKEKSAHQIFDLSNDIVVECGSLSVIKTPSMASGKESHTTTTSDKVEEMKKVGKTIVSCLKSKLSKMLLESKAKCVVLTDSDEKHHGLHKESQKYMHPQDSEIWQEGKSATLNKRQGHDNTINVECSRVPVIKNISSSSVNQLSLLSSNNEGIKKLNSKPKVPSCHEGKIHEKASKVNGDCSYLSNERRLSEPKDLGNTGVIGNERSLLNGQCSNPKSDFVIEQKFIHIVPTPSKPDNNQIFPSKSAINDMSKKIASKLTPSAAPELKPSDKTKTRQDISIQSNDVLGTAFRSPLKSSCNPQIPSDSGLNKKEASRPSVKVCHEEDLKKAIELPKVKEKSYHFSKECKLNQKVSQVIEECRKKDEASVQHKEKSISLSEDINIESIDGLRTAVRTPLKNSCTKNFPTDSGLNRKETSKPSLQVWNEGTLLTKGIDLPKTKEKSYHLSKECKLNQKCSAVVEECRMKDGAFIHPKEKCTSLSEDVDIESIDGLGTAVSTPLKNSCNQETPLDSGPNKKKTSKPSAQSSHEDDFMKAIDLPKAKGKSYNLPKECKMNQKCSAVVEECKMKDGTFIHPKEKCTSLSEDVDIESIDGLGTAVSTPLKNSCNQEIPLDSGPNKKKTNKPAQSSHEDDFMKAIDLPKAKGKSYNLPKECKMNQKCSAVVEECKMKDGTFIHPKEKCTSLSEDVDIESIDGLGTAVSTPLKNSCNQEIPLDSGPNKKKTNKPAQSSHEDDFMKAIDLPKAKGKSYNLPKECKMNQKCSAVVEECKMKDGTFIHPKEKCTSLSEDVDIESIDGLGTAVSTPLKNSCNQEIPLDSGPNKKKTNKPAQSSHEDDFMKAIGLPKAKGKSYNLPKECKMNQKCSLVVEECRMKEGVTIQPKEGSTSLSADVNIESIDGLGTAVRTSLKNSCNQRIPTDSGLNRKEASKPSVQVCHEGDLLTKGIDLPKAKEKIDHLPKECKLNQKCSAVVEERRKKDGTSIQHKEKSTSLSEDVNIESIDGLGTAVKTPLKNSCNPQMPTVSGLNKKEASKPSAQSSHEDDFMEAIDLPKAKEKSYHLPKECKVNQKSTLVVEECRMNDGVSIQPKEKSTFLSAELNLEGIDGLGTAVRTPLKNSCHQQIPSDSGVNRKEASKPSVQVCHEGDLLTKSIDLPKTKEKSYHLPIECKLNQKCSLVVEECRMKEGVTIQPKERSTSLSADINIESIDVLGTAVRTPLKNSSNPQIPTVSGLNKKEVSKPSAQSSHEDDLLTEGINLPKAKERCHHLPKECKSNQKSSQVVEKCRMNDGVSIQPKEKSTFLSAELNLEGIDGLRTAVRTPLKNSCIQQMLADSGLDKKEASKPSVQSSHEGDLTKGIDLPKAKEKCRHPSKEYKSKLKSSQVIEKCRQKDGRSKEKSTSLSEDVDIQSFDGLGFAVRTPLKNSCNQQMPADGGLNKKEASKPSAQSSHEVDLLTEGIDLHKAKETGNLSIECKSYQKCSQEDGSSVGMNKRCPSPVNGILAGNIDELMKEYEQLTSKATTVKISAGRKMERRPSQKKMLTMFGEEHLIEDCQSIFQSSSSSKVITDNFFVLNQTDSNKEQHTSHVENITKVKSSKFDSEGDSTNKKDLNFSKLIAGKKRKLSEELHKKETGKWRRTSVDALSGNESNQGQDFTLMKNNLTDKSKSFTPINFHAVGSNVSGSSAKDKIKISNLVTVNSSSVNKMKNIDFINEDSENARKKMKKSKESGISSGKHKTAKNEVKKTERSLSISDMSLKMNQLKRLNDNNLSCNPVDENVSSKSISHDNVNKNEKSEVFSANVNVVLEKNSNHNENLDIQAKAKEHAEISVVEKENISRPKNNRADFSTVSSKVGVENSPCSIQESPQGIKSLGAINSLTVVLEDTERSLSVSDRSSKMNPLKRLNDNNLSCNPVDENVSSKSISHDNVNKNEKSEVFSAIVNVVLENNSNHNENLDIQAKAKEHAEISVVEKENISRPKNNRADFSTVRSKVGVENSPCSIQESPQGNKSLGAINSLTVVLGETNTPSDAPRRTGMPLQEKTIDKLYESFVAEEVRMMDVSMYEEPNAISDAAKKSSEHLIDDEASITDISYNEYIRKLEHEHEVLEKVVGDALSKKFKIWQQIQHYHGIQEIKKEDSDDGTEDDCQVIFSSNDLVYVKEDSNSSEATVVLDWSDDSPSTQQNGLLSFANSKKNECEAVAGSNVSRKCSSTISVNSVTSSTVEGDTGAVTCTTEEANHSTSKNEGSENIRKKNKKDLVVKPTEILANNDLVRSSTAAELGIGLEVARISQNDARNQPVKTIADPAVSQKKTVLVYNNNNTSMSSFRASRDNQLVQGVNSHVSSPLLSSGLQKSSGEIGNTSDTTSSSYDSVNNSKNNPPSAGVIHSQGSAATPIYDVHSVNNSAAVASENSINVRGERIRVRGIEDLLPKPNNQISNRCSETLTQNNEFLKECFIDIDGVFYFNYLVSYMLIIARKIEECMANSSPASSAAPVIDEPLKKYCVCIYKLFVEVTVRYKDDPSSLISVLLMQMVSRWKDFKGFLNMDTLKLSIRCCFSKCLGFLPAEKHHQFVIEANSLLLKLRIFNPLSLENQSANTRISGVSERACKGGNAGVSNSVQSGNLPTAALPSVSTTVSCNVNINQINHQSGGYGANNNNSINHAAIQVEMPTPATQIQHLPVLPYQIVVNRNNSRQVSTQNVAQPSAGPNAHYRTPYLRNIQPNIGQKPSNSRPEGEVVHNMVTVPATLNNPNMQRLINMSNNIQMRNMPLLASHPDRLHQQNSSMRNLLLAPQVAPSSISQESVRSPTQLRSGGQMKQNQSRLVPSTSDCNSRVGLVSGGNTSLNSEKSSNTQILNSSQSMCPKTMMQVTHQMPPRATMHEIPCNTLSEQPPSVSCQNTTKAAPSTRINMLQQHLLSRPAPPPYNVVVGRDLSAYQVPSSGNAPIPGPSMTSSVGRSNSVAQRLSSNPSLRNVQSLHAQDTSPLRSAVAIPTLNSRRNSSCQNQPENLHPAVNHLHRPPIPAQHHSQVQVSENNNHFANMNRYEISCQLTVDPHNLCNVLNSSVSLDTTGRKDIGGNTEQRTAGYYGGNYNNIAASQNENITRDIFQQHQQGQQIIQENSLGARNIVATQSHPIQRLHKSKTTRTNYSDVNHCSSSYVGNSGNSLSYAGDNGHQHTSENLSFQHGESGSAIGIAHRFEQSQISRQLISSTAYPSQLNSLQEAPSDDSILSSSHHSNFQHSIVFDPPPYNNTLTHVQQLEAGPCRQPLLNPDPVYDISPGLFPEEGDQARGQGVGRSISRDSGYRSPSQGAESSANNFRACYVCHKEARLTCSRCKSLYYCHHNCQAGDWSRHRWECKAPEGRVCP